MDLSDVGQEKPSEQTGMLTRLYPKQGMVCLLAWFPFFSVCYYGTIQLLNIFKKTTIKLVNQHIKRVETQSERIHIKNFKD